METRVNSELWVKDPSVELITYCKKQLTFDNPEFLKKKRMGFWTGNTPPKLKLYKIIGGEYVLPYGCFDTAPDIYNNPVKYEHDGFNSLNKINYGGEIPLYDYQDTAVTEMLKHDNGILQSKAGSGKTQMGLAIIQKLGYRALWLTHTKDLLTQSKNRAAQYLDSSLFGEITNGEVNIGKGITFATVQTAAKIDPSIYRNMFDIVIVDECHRVAGTPTALTQFAKVLSNCNAPYKFGLSATVHRADNMIKSTFAYLGNIKYIVPDEAIADKVMDVKVVVKRTGIQLDSSCVDTDGTLIYAKLISYLADSFTRNILIAMDLADNTDHYNLILSDRREHLKKLMELLPENDCVMIDGTMTSKAAKAKREQAIQDMRDGKKHYLFATYRLAKEGLDIPRLDRLYLTTPQKDYAVVTQSIGRIDRTFEGKTQPICYDYLDDIGYLQRAFKQRVRHYKKANCEVIYG